MHFFIRPGRDFAEHKINSPASCFATHDNLLAMGSWNTTITLYNTSEFGTYKSIGKMHGHSGNNDSISDNSYSNFFSFTHNIFLPAISSVLI